MTVIILHEKFQGNQDLAKISLIFVSIISSFKISFYDDPDCLRLYNWAFRFAYHLKALMKKDLGLKDLQRIPGVGKKLSKAFWNIGIRSIGELNNQDPEDLYQRLCEFEGAKVDRCVLYIFRCAVYYASNTNHNPRLLKWWNWKDQEYT